jgi:hypothetical protein
MSCHDARELFSALIDKTLTREERADVYGHLTTCAECRRELAAIERTVALVRGASPVRAPAGFVDRVLDAARPTPWYRRAARAALLPWPLKVPLGAVAVLLVAGLAVLMSRGSQEQQSAARHDTTPPVLADRRVIETPTEPPATAAPTAPPASPAPGAASTDPAEKRDETETRADSKTDAAPAENFGAARAPAPAKREALTAKAAAKPDVIARLATPDRDTAERALAALAARFSGEVAGRRVEGETTVVELLIPRDRYGDFTREAARLGVFRVESEAPAPPDSVRIAVRVGA